MIRVCLLTTWGPGCGTSEHARHIVDHALDPEVQISVEVRTIGDAVNAREHLKRRYDIIHVNESGWLLQGLTPDTIAQFKAIGMKTLLTMNASCPTNNRNPWSNQFDQVVIFEPHTDDGFNYVPIGAPVFTPSGKPKEKYIGTNGFPQERKNLLNLAEACQELGYSLMSFMPESIHANAEHVASEIKRRNPTAITRTEWVSDAAMIEGLSICTATCYPYLEWFQGSSSAAMAGVSARVPLIVSRASQFDFLFSSDEVYFIEAARPTKDEIVAGIRKCLEDNPQKIPNKLYEEHRWDAVGRRYIEVYKGMMK